MTRTAPSRRHFSVITAAAISGKLACSFFPLASGLLAACGKCNHQLARQRVTQSAPFLAPVINSQRASNVRSRGRGRRDVQLRAACDLLVGRQLAAGLERISVDCAKSNQLMIEIWNESKRERRVGYSSTCAVAAPQQEPRRRWRQSLLVRTTDAVSAARVCRRRRSR